LKPIRQELRRKIRTAFNNISDMLSGGSESKKGKEDNMQGGSILGAVLDFAEAEISKPRATGPLNGTPGI
jgi:hypothetical protein